VYEALKKCFANDEGVLEADLNIFSHESTVDKASIWKQLVLTFGTDEDPKI